MCARTEAGPTGGGGAWPGFETTHRATYQRPGATVWRAPERSAAVPVGGGGAWPGFETTRRAKLAGGPPPTGTHSGRALRRPEHPWGHKQHSHTAGSSGAQNTRGATHAAGTLAAQHAT